MFQLNLEFEGGHVFLTVLNNKCIMIVELEDAETRRCTLSLRDLTVLRKNLNEIISYMQGDENEPDHDD